MTTKKAYRRRTRGYNKTKVEIYFIVNHLLNRIGLIFLFAHILYLLHIFYKPLICYLCTQWYN